MKKNEVSRARDGKLSTEDCGPIKSRDSVFFKTFVFVIFFSVAAMGKGKSKVQRPPFPFDAGAFGGQGVPPPRRPQPSCVAAPSLRGVTLISGVVAFVVFCVFFPRSLR